MATKGVKVHIPRVNAWMVAALTLFIVLVAFAVLNTAGIRPVSAMTADEVGKKCVDYINGNLVQPGTSATLAGVKDLGGIYEVTTTYQGSNISVYSTKDGKMMFLSGFVDITKPIPKDGAAAQGPSPQKADKPVVQLFVMSFCPYGIQAEQAMKPVADLLGSKADIKVHFIASVGGTTPDTVQSLHGAVEAQEDLRQVCIMKYYDQKTYWNYMMGIDANCSSRRGDSAAYDTCWKNAATKVGIDVSKTTECSTGSEGMGLIKADADLSAHNGVSGSPTLIINGVTYNGERTSEAFKQSVCSAFTTAPSECSNALSSTGGNVSGGCGG